MKLISPVDLESSILNSYLAKKRQPQASKNTSWLCMKYPGDIVTLPTPNSALQLGTQKPVDHRSRFSADGLKDQ